jgi:hypothetical protein
MEWELMYYPDWPFGGPIVGPRFVGRTNAGSKVPDNLEAPVTCAGFHWRPGPSGNRILLLHGQVQSIFDQVEIEGVDGERAPATVVDCSARFGFNYFVAVLLNGDATEAIATCTSDGTTASTLVE